jgi:hypothetical protein
VSRALPAIRQLVASLAVVAVAGCTTGQSSTTPPTTFTSSRPVLSFTVGTVNFSQIAVGLNVLETFRGTNGYTAIPVNTATLSGPAGFVGTPGSADPGSGKPSVPLGVDSARNVFSLGPALTTQLDAADGFGIGPPLSSTTAQNPYPEQPQFLDGVGKLNPYFGEAFPQTQPIYGGPPAYPLPATLSSANDEFLSVPSGWSEGFYMLALLQPAPSGPYTLKVNYAQSGIAGSASATAKLNGQIVLPPIPPPQITGNGAGASVFVELTPGIVTALVNVLDVNSLFPPTPTQTCVAAISYATLSVKTSGNYTISPTLGPNGSPTFCPGDELVAQVYGFDYDEMALGPPANTSQHPALPAQADVSVSVPGVYPTPPPTSGGQARTRSSAASVSPRNATWNATMSVTRGNFGWTRTGASR